MGDQLYRLFYRDIEIGFVRQRDADFPNVWGEFEPAPEVAADSTRSRINRYIENVREFSRLASAEGENGEAMGRCAKEGDEFIDLIECDDWSLVDAAGVKHRILAPNFDESEIIWRWA